MSAERNTVAQVWRRRLYVAFVTGLIAASGAFVTMAPPAHAAVETYADDFATYDFGGSTGSLTWSLPWLESEGDGPASGGVVVGDDARCAIDPCLMIGKGGADDLWAARHVALNPGAVVSLDYEYQIHTHGAGSGEVQVGVSDDAGISWTVLTTYSLTSDAGPTAESFDISVYATALTVIQVRLVGGTDDTHINIDNVLITVSENGAPVVDAIAPVSGSEESTISFTATASDPEGDPFTFGLAGEPAGALIDAATGVFSWTPTEAQGPAVYTFDVTATDDAPATGSTAVTITVGEAPQSPAVAPIADRTDAEGDAVSWSIVATDPDIPTDVLAYDASGLPAGVTIDAATGALSGSIAYTAAAASPYAVVVSVDDGVNPPVESAFTWSVTNTDRPPVVAPVAPVAVDELALAGFTASAIDPDGDAVVFGLSGAPAGASIDPVSGVFSWTPDETQGPGVYTFDITATDPEPLAGTTTVTVTVGEVNLPPALPAIGDQADAEGSTVSLAVSADDSDSPANALSYSASGLPPGLGIDPDTGTVGGIVGFGAASASPYSVTVTAVDDGTPPLQDLVSFQWTIADTNRPPVLDPVADQTGDEGTPITFTATATDPDLDAITFTLAGTVPAGAVVDGATGVFTWVPGETQDGVWSFDVVVIDDGAPPLSATRTLAITVGEVNSAPVIAPLSNQASTEGDVVAVTVVADDADRPTDTLTWSAVGLPAGLAIDPATGVISGTIDFTAADTSPHSVTLTVLDDGSPALQANHSFEWMVADTNRPPALDPVGDRSVAEHEPVAFTASARDPDGDRLAYSLSRAPAAATIDPETGAFTWTPGEHDDGVHEFEVVVTDDGTPALSHSRTLVVTVGEVNRPPTLDPIPDRSDLEGASISFAPVATDSDVPANRLTWAAASLPPGISIDPATGVVRGAIDHSASGDSPYTVTIHVTDGEGGTCEVHFTWTVTDVNRPPVLEPFPDVSIEPGERAAFRVRAVDPDGDDVSFGLGGTRPVGAFIDAKSGVFEWTAPSDSAPGVHPVEIVASDARGAMATATATITVRAPNQAPVAIDQSISVPEDSETSIVLRATDEDVDLLTFDVTTHPGGGLITGDPPQLTYRPDPNYNGRDRVEFRVTDVSGAVDTGVIDIDVAPVNDAPIAEPDRFGTTSYRVLRVAAPGVLANDSDVDDVRLTVEVIAPVARGVLDLARDGSFTYDPEPGFAGEVRFSYAAVDGDGARSRGIVTIEITTPAPASPARVAAVDAIIAFATPPEVGADLVPGGTVQRTLVLMRRASGVAVQQMSLPFVLLLVAAVGVAALGRLRVIPVLGRRQIAHGTVQSYSRENGFGLIARNTDGTEVFVHRSAVRHRDRDRIGPGDRVRFRIVPGEHRDLATGLRLDPQ